MKNFGTKLGNTLRRTANTISNTTFKTTNTIGEQAKRAKNTVSRNLASNDGIYGRIKNNLLSAMSTTSSFAEANSSIAKVVFILLMVIVFGLLLRIGFYVLQMLYAPAKNPIIINGMRSTNKEKEYNVNPNSKDPTPILRSINENQGMEFTWSTWFWMEDVNYSNSTTKKVIFTKGKDISENVLFNSPGLYAHGDTNKIDVVMSLFETETRQTLNDINETITISNIPLKKWVNIIIRVQNNTIDVYLNGTLVERKNLDAVPKQNYGNIYVGNNANGMNGYISSLRYFSYAIGPMAIQEILYNGPDLKMEANEFMDTQPPYLAMRWYFDQANHDET